jgi:hypothetical protein
MNSYPTEEQLEQIRLWPFDTDYLGLMKFIKSIWEYAEWGWLDSPSCCFHKPLQACDCDCHPNGPTEIVFEISTGGWSGNEEIISAMQKNRMFWSLCWVSSRRGGHYVFEVFNQE